MLQSLRKGQQQKKNGLIKQRKKDQSEQNDLNISKMRFLRSVSKQPAV